MNADRPYSFYSRTGKGYISVYGDGSCTFELGQVERKKGGGDYVTIWACFFSGAAKLCDFDPEKGTCSSQDYSTHQKPVESPPRVLPQWARISKIVPK